MNNTPVKCQWCGIGVQALALKGGYLARTNPKGMPGKWQCIPLCHVVVKDAPVRVS